MNRHIIESFSKRATHRFGIDLYNTSDAIMLVKLCQKLSIPILGIDAFRIYGEKIQPSMDNSIDLSYEKECYDKAISFLTNRNGMNFMYEIVCDN